MLPLQASYRNSICILRKYEDCPDFITSSHPIIGSALQKIPFSLLSWHALFSASSCLVSSSQARWYNLTWLEKCESETQLVCSSSSAGWPRRLRLYTPKWSPFPSNINQTISILRLHRDSMKDTFLSSRDESLHQFIKTLRHQMLILASLRNTKLFSIKSSAQRKWEASSHGKKCPAVISLELYSKYLSIL